MKVELKVLQLNRTALLQYRKTAAYSGKEPQHEHNNGDSGLMFLLISGALQRSALDDVK